ncbi:unnamed protein product, partial [Prorocentrum cordatum]
AWFELLACGGSAVDLAACPAGRGGAPALLDVLAGVQLSEGVLGAYTPSPLRSRPTSRATWLGGSGPTAHKAMAGPRACAGWSGGGCWEAAGRPGARTSSCARRWRLSAPTAPRCSPASCWAAARAAQGFRHRRRQRVPRRRS